MSLLGRKSPEEPTTELFVKRFAPGHYYSPLPNMDEVQARRERLFDRSAEALPGIALNTDVQLALLETFSREYVSGMGVYAMEKTPGLRFHHNNSFYSRRDATMLHCMMRHLQPKRIIEIGSGFSSAMMLDTNERFFDRGIQLTFIEPYPQRLYENIRPADKSAVRILEQKLEDLDLGLFGELRPGDILFVDSTHVSKIGSDVNRIIFDLFPSLPAGVWIHVHDIFYPFEYLEEWVLEGRAWNEAYMMRAFLMYNTYFSIRLFTDYLTRKFPERFDSDAWRAIPEGGSRSSLWIEKVS